MLSMCGDRIYIGLHFRKCVGYAVRVRLTGWIVKTIAGMAPNLNSACAMCVYAWVTLTNLLASLPVPLAIRIAIADSNDLTVAWHRVCTIAPKRRNGVADAIADGWNCRLAMLVTKRKQRERLITQILPPPILGGGVKLTTLYGFAVWRYLCPQQGNTLTG